MSHHAKLLHHLNAQVKDLEDKLALYKEVMGYLIDCQSHNLRQIGMHEGEILFHQFEIERYLRGMAPPLAIKKQSTPKQHGGGDGHGAL